MKAALICGIFREKYRIFVHPPREMPFFPVCPIVRPSCARRPLRPRNRAESRPAAANRVAARKRNALSFRLHPLLARYLAVRRRNETVLFLD